jgi:hypothetical protein
MSVPKAVGLNTGSPVAYLYAPTAQQSFAEVQVTPLRRLARAPLFGEGTIDQELPFHFRMRVRSISLSRYVPTAQQSELDAHATLLSALC